MNQKSKSSLKLIVKFGIVGGLLYYLAKRGFISVEETKRAFSHYENIIPAFIAMFTNAILSIYRWHILLKAQGIVISWKRVLQLGFVGGFFNIALPGAVSGDVVKAVYVAREVQGHRARALGSILFDRVAGVSALVMISMLALLMSMGSNWGVDLFHAIEVFVVSCGIFVVSFYTYLFLVREHHDPLLYCFKKLEARLPAAGSLTRIYEGIRTYHSEKTAVLKALGISFIIHLLVVFACLQFSLALGEELRPLALGVLVPLGLLVTAIPITPAGVGTGHAAFSWLFHLLGSQRGADVFSIFVVFQLFFGALGGLVYLRFKASEPMPELDINNSK